MLVLQRALDDHNKISECRARRQTLSTSISEDSGMITHKVVLVIGTQAS